MDRFFGPAKKFRWYRKRGNGLPEDSVHYNKINTQWMTSFHQPRACSICAFKLIDKSFLRQKRRGSEEQKPFALARVYMLESRQDK